MRRYRAFTMIEFIIVFLILALLCGLLWPMFSRMRREAAVARDRSRMRGVHQGMVIFSASNAGFFPGLDSRGNIAADGPLTGHSGSGDRASARLWILLNGKFVDGDMLVFSSIDPACVAYEMPSNRSSIVPLSKVNFSFAMLSIQGLDTSTGRSAEWRDGQNSCAPMLCDRNIGKSASDIDVQSLWTNQSGKWFGWLAYGDNHVDFVQSHIIPTTRYGGITQSNDNLFATTRAAGVTEDSTHPDANALMVWN